MRNATLIALVAGAGVWFYRFGVRDHVIPRNFGVVDAGQVFRSGRLTPSTTKQVVEAHGIRTIVDLGAYVGDSERERVAADTARALGVRRFAFSLEGDGTGDPQQYVEALRLIADPANRPVLVHCAAGAQRSSACVLFYRAVYQGQSIEAGIDEAKAHRHDPEDNPAMLAYVRRWLGPIERAIRTGEPVARDGDPGASTAAPTSAPTGPAQR